MARGPEAVRAALIDAAADLFASQGDVSVRAIAAKAGVNHGLVHHYFEGKDGLRRAVLDKLAAAQAETLEGVDLDDPVALIEASLAAARPDDRYLRVLARALIDGEVPQPFQNAYPVVRRLITALRKADVEEPKLRVAQGLAVVFGWALFEPWIRAATGLSAADGGRVVDEALADNLTLERA